MWLCGYVLCGYVAVWRLCGYVSIFGQGNPYHQSTYRFPPLHPISAQPDRQQASIIQHRSSISNHASATTNHQHQAKKYLGLGMLPCYTESFFPSNLSFRTTDPVGHAVRDSLGPCRARCHDCGSCVFFSGASPPPAWVYLGISLSYLAICLAFPRHVVNVPSRRSHSQRYQICRRVCLQLQVPPP